MYVMQELFTMATKDARNRRSKQPTGTRWPDQKRAAAAEKDADKLQLVFLKRKQKKNGKKIPIEIEREVAARRGDIVSRILQS